MDKAINLEIFPETLFTVDGLLDISPDFSRLGGTLNHVQATKPLPASLLPDPNTVQPSFLAQLFHTLTYLLHSAVMAYFAVWANESSTNEQMIGQFGRAFEMWRLTPLEQREGDNANSFHRLGYARKILFQLTAQQARETTMFAALLLSPVRDTLSFPFTSLIPSVGLVHWHVGPFEAFGGLFTSNGWRDHSDDGKSSRNARTKCTLLRARVLLASLCGCVCDYARISSEPRRRPKARLWWGQRRRGKEGKRKDNIRATLYWRCTWFVQPYLIRWANYQSRYAKNPLTQSEFWNSYTFHWSELKDNLLVATITVFLVSSTARIAQKNVFVATGLFPSLMGLALKELFWPKISTLLASCWQGQGFAQSHILQTLPPKGENSYNVFNPGVYDLTLPQITREFFLQLVRFCDSPTKR